MGHPSWTDKAQGYILRFGCKISQVSAGVRASCFIFIIQHNLQGLSPN